MYEGGNLHRLTHKDSTVEMMVRRALTVDYTPNTVDPYNVGFRLLQEAGVHLDDCTKTLLDVGSNNCIPLSNSIISNGIKARVIAVDPDREPYSWARPFLPKCGLMFVQGYGEELHFLPDNSVDVVTAHKVFFRGNALRMLEELRRVLKLGGFGVATTNGRTFTEKGVPVGHAFERYVFERRIRQAVGHDMNLKLGPWQEAAHGCFAEDFPDLLGAVRGLNLVTSYRRRSISQIMPDGVRDRLFLLSLETAVNGLNAEGIHTAGLDRLGKIFQSWRYATNQIAGKEMRAHFRRQEERDPTGKRRRLLAPYFPFYEDVVDWTSFLFQKTG